ncbi:MAG: hypothetical protein AAGA48_00545 [Myxococcota bacterium]
MVSPFLWIVTGCIFVIDGDDDVEPQTSPPIDNPAPPSNVVEWNLDGDRSELVLQGSVDLVDSPASILTLQASTPSSTLAIVVSDLMPLDVGSYPVGRWGEPAQTTQFGYGDVDVVTATARTWATDMDAKGTGSFTIEVLDRAAGLVSGRFSGEIDEIDQGVVLDTVPFEGRFDSLPLVLQEP